MRGTGVNTGGFGCGSLQVAAAALSQGRQLAMDRGNVGGTRVLKGACPAGKPLAQWEGSILKNTEAHQMLKVC